MELIIAEKPSAALKIANALADGKAIKENINRLYSILSLIASRKVLKLIAVIFFICV